MGLSDCGSTSDRQRIHLQTCNTMHMAFDSSTVPYSWTMSRSNDEAMMFDGHMHIANAFLKPSPACHWESHVVISNQQLLIQTATGSSQNAPSFAFAQWLVHGQCVCWSSSWQASCHSWSAVTWNESIKLALYTAQLSQYSDIVFHFGRSFQSE